jgi:hypothetical protein
MALDAVSALLKGQPKIAVRGLDLGLATWLAGPADQAALTWCRGVIVMDRLRDPSTALLDLRDAHQLLPPWIADEAPERLQRCREAAAASRKRVASVGPRPEFTGADHVRHTVARRVSDRRDGEKPSVWEDVAGFFTA